MARFYLALLILINSLYSYSDAYSDTELDSLWASIADINNPVLSDYRMIENYLRTGRRAYLDDLDSLVADRQKLSFIRNLALIGLENEMPIFENHSVNVTDETKDRCILLYGSFNRIYPQKARTILEEIKQSGYSGHVLLRIGGFPNTPNGGLRLCHIPYAFKVAFLQEARLLGYKELLWLDTSMHPLTNLEVVFSQIKKRGYFLTYVATLRQTESSHLPAAAKSLGISNEHYDKIHHLSSALIGLNMNHPKASDFLSTWYAETERVYPNISGCPEELCFSVTAWRSKLKPLSWFGTYVCAPTELPSIREFRPMLQFYLDGVR